MPAKKRVTSSVPKTIATLPNSWLYSNSFLKRAFAVWGHYMIAHLLIIISLGIIAIVISITFGELFHSL